MKVPLLLLAFTLACGGGDPPPEECDQPLPATDDDGMPWPTYTTARANLADCEQSPGVTGREGTCADGKVLLARDGGSGGDTYYFQGETLVGLRRSSDLVISCQQYFFGDTRCDDADVEDITCL